MLPTDDATMDDDDDDDEDGCILRLATDAAVGADVG